MPSLVKSLGLSLLVLSIMSSCGHEPPPSAGRRVDVTIKGKTLTIKDLDKNTTESCQCPCSTSFQDEKNPVTYSCGEQK
jgi:hypothetical protein